MTRFPFRIRNIFLYFIFSLLICLPLSAEIINDETFGFSLDIPEGFQLADATDDGMSLLFSHPNIPITLALKLYMQDENANSKDVLNVALSKLKATSQIDTFKWNENQCAISSFTMNLDQSYSGWAVCTNTNPNLIKDAYIVLICYAPTNNFDACSQFIMSTLNSLCVDNDFYNTPGIILSYAYPKEGTKRITLNINGNKIVSSLDKSDCEAARFLVDMEYGVLMLYGNHPLWKEAWQRYYRLIYRDNYGRLGNVIFDIYNILWPLAKTKKTGTPEIEYAQQLLTWTQNFNYQRADSKSQSDFTSLPEAICGVGNDCDSRSLLLCVLLKSIGIESLLLISPEYSHAMIATEIEAPGQVYELPDSDRYFLFGETTAKVTWGMIAQDFADQSKWIPVILP